MGTMCVGAKLSVGVGKADMDRVVAPSGHRIGQSCPTNTYHSSFSCNCMSEIMISFSELYGITWIGFLMGVRYGYLWGGIQP